jgi:magnesium-transporting ATPase (P-type)
MTSVVEHNGRPHIFTKGAPDYLLPNCEFYLDENTKLVKIDDEYKQNLLNKLKEFAEGTLRTILLAYRVGDAGIQDK